MQPTVGICTYGLSGPDLAHLAPLVEAAGFESLWVGEHLVVPSVVGSAHPTRGDTLLSHGPTTGPRASILDPATVLADPVVALAAAAARTTTLRLGTAIYILPLRHPLDTARAVATLQSVAAGPLPARSRFRVAGRGVQRPRCRLRLAARPLRGEHRDRPRRPGRRPDLALG